MLHLDTHSCNRAVLRFLLAGQLLAARLFVWLLERGACNGIPLKTEVLIQHAAFGQRIVHGIGNRFVVDTSLIGVAQEQNTAGRVHQQEVLYGMRFLFAIVVVGAVVRIAGSRDGSLRSVVKKRGAGAGSAGAACCGRGPGRRCWPSRRRV